MIAAGQKFKLLKIFVYGTLKPGGSNYSAYCSGKVMQAQAVIAQGILFELPAGYPAMTLGAGWVQGSLLWFQDRQMLEQLDYLEDYDPSRSPDKNLYHRQQIQVFDPSQQPLGDAWVYLMSPAKIQCLGGIFLPEGHWP